MKISVIMPVYKAEKYLADAIESVLAQDVDLEIIAIDDCSPDSSREILGELARKDSRIKPYFNEENVGVATVRNLALGYASGDYLAFCDSDDVVPRGAYKALLSVIGKNDIAIGTYENVYDDRGSDGVCPIYPSEKSSLFKSLFSVSCLWTKLIKREFVVKHNLTFDPSMKIGEDVVFLSHLATKSPSYAVTDFSVYHHCHHDTSVSRSLTHIYTLAAFSKHIECRNRILTICESIPEARDFVYINFSGFLTDFIPLISDLDEREDAFLLYKQHLLAYDFEKKPLLFNDLIGVPYKKLVDMTASEYFEAKDGTPPRERVFLEFRCGMIGLRWIFKYFFAWLKFKIKRNYE